MRVGRVVAVLFALPYQANDRQLVGARIALSIALDTRVMSGEDAASNTGSPRMHERPGRV